MGSVKAPPPHPTPLPLSVPSLPHPYTTQYTHTVVNVYRLTDLAEGGGLGVGQDHLDVHHDGAQRLVQRLEEVQHA